ncbi:CXCR5 protein, partial [Amia calva]|nr:CXCR5 protein [Amia calva]
MVGGTVGLEGRLLCHRKFHWENSDHWRVGLQLLGLGLGFLVPLLVMLYCYTCIFRSLCLAPRPPTQRQRSLRLIISIVGVFLVCWGPYNGFLLTDSLQRLGVVGRSCALDKALDLGTLVSESLALAHCALNPLLYAFVGVKFRRELGHLGKEALGWCRGKSRRGGWGRRGWGSDGGGRGQRSTRVSERSLTASESESSAMYYSVMV